MSAISLIHKTRDTVIATTSAVWTDVDTTAALTAGTTYYVVCHAIVEGSDSNKTFGWRLLDETNGDTVLTGSTMTLEPAQGTVTQSYYFVGKFTAGSDGGGLKFQQRNTTSSFPSTTVKTRYLSLMLMDLSNLRENVDYFFATNTTETALTTSEQDFATKSITTTAGDNWLVWAFADIDVDNVAHNVVIDLERKSSGIQVSTNPTMSFEGEDLTEQNLWAFCRGYSASAASNGWTVRAKLDNASGAGKHTNSSVFGLNLSSFENSYFEYTNTLNDTTSTDWVELDSKAFTPTSAGDVVVFATAIFEPESTNRKSYGRVQIDGTTSPNIIPATKYSVNSRDGTAFLPLMYVTKYTGSAGVAATVDWDVKKEASAEYGWQEYTLAIFSTNIIDVVPENYSAVASSVYNSGDVASQTIQAGDVASEINP